MSGARDDRELRERVAALEGESQCRRTLSRYMELCDSLDATTDMVELGELFCEDAVWEGRGGKYGDAFGGHRGRRTIVAFLNSYREPEAHFESNAHFLTSEQIEVRGPRAHGSWVMLQTPTFRDGSSFLLAARLRVAFRRDSDAWRIERFSTTNLFSRPIEGGWELEAALPVPMRTSKGNE